MRKKTLFFPYEIEKMIDEFPPSKATLLEDLKDFELEAVDQMGLLANDTQFYLGW